MNINGITCNIESRYRYEASYMYEASYELRRAISVIVGRFSVCRFAGLPVLHVPSEVSSLVKEMQTSEFGRGWLFKSCFKTICYHLWIIVTCG